MEAERQVRYLTVPRAEQRTSPILRMGERQLSPEIPFFGVRRVGKQRPTTCEVVAIHPVAFCIARTVYFKGPREPIEDVEQYDKAIRSALCERNPCKRRETILRECQPLEPVSRSLTQIAPRTDERRPVPQCLLERFRGPPVFERRVSIIQPLRDLGAKSLQEVYDSTPTERR